MSSTEPSFRGVKNKADILVKDPFHCTNDISKGVSLEEEKDTLKRSVEAEDKLLLFSVFLYDAVVKVSIL